MAKTIYANVKGKNVFLLTTSCVLFSAQIIMAILFFTGVVDYYGMSITAFGAVELILSILNITASAVFEHLLKLALGVIYIVSTVIIIKNLITSITYFIRAMSANGENAQKIKETSFLVLFDYLGGTAQACFRFILLAVMTSVDYTINGSGMTVLVMAIVCYLSSLAITFYLKNLTLECIIYRVIATVVMLVGLILFVDKIRIASFEQLIDGFKFMFSGYLAVISTQAAIFEIIKIVAIPILYIVLQFHVFAFMANFWSADFYLDTADDITGKFMGLAIAISTINLFITMFLNNLQAINVAQIFKIIENELPMLISTIVLFVGYRIDDFKEYRKVVVTPVVNKEIKEEAKAEVADTPTQAPTPKQEETPAPVKEVAATVEEKPKKTETQHLQIGVVEEMKRYKELLDGGILTQEEFDKKKKDLLGL